MVGGPRLGLATRFALLIALVLAVAFALSAFFNIAERDRLLREDLRGEGRLIGRFVALVSPEAILAHDFETLNDYAREISAHDDFVYGVLLDERGVPLTAHLDADKPLVARVLNQLGDRQTAQLLEALERDPEVIPLSFPIHHAGRTLGSVELGLSTARLEHERREAWRSQLGRSGVLILLLALGIGAVFRGAVLARVNRLMEGVHRVRAGVLDQPVRVTSRDELGELTRTFNETTLTLAEQRERLTNVNADLERAVAERTGQLNRELEERRRAEETLRRSIAHNRELLEAGSEAYIDLDADGSINYFNGAAEALFDTPRDQAVGGELWSVLPALLHPCRGRFEVARAKGEPSRFEVYIPDLAKWLEIHAHPGEEGMWAFFRDVTVAKQAVATAAESEERLHTLLEASPDLILFKDANGRWLEASPAALRLFGLERVNYKGLTAAELSELAAPEMGEVLTAMAAGDRHVWAEGRTVRGEERFTAADGSSHSFEVTQVPLFFDSGAPRGLVVLARDISERKRLERALAKADPSAVE